MTTVLVAHGTRNPRGVAMIGDLAAAMSARLHEPVHAAFVDVLGPSPTEVLGRLAEHHAARDQPVAVVPAFLARGYHVRVDLPAHVAAAGHPAVATTPALGPAPELAAALAARLRAAGHRRGDAVVLAAAGSSDPTAVADVDEAAALLGTLIGTAVSVGFAAPPADGSAHPGVAEAVRAARAGGTRVAVASYLLAEGLFQQRLARASADVVAAPLGLHPHVVALACRRVRAVRARVGSPA